MKEIYNMSKIYLTEQDLTKVIEESVREVIKENEQNEFLGTALALGGLAAGASYLGKKRQQGYTPWKNAFNWTKSKINGTEYQRQVNRPTNDELWNVTGTKGIRQFQRKYFTKYGDKTNIVVGVWGPYEQQIYDAIKRSKEEDTEQSTPSVQSTPDFQVRQGGGGKAKVAGA